MEDLEFNKFKDTILSEVGEILISNTQKLRVLIVLDFNTGKKLVSAQKWWRPNDTEEWRVSKGLKFHKQRGIILSDLILKACSQL